MKVQTPDVKGGVLEKITSSQRIKAVSGVNVSMHGTSGRWEEN
jgi:hypothetical protein